MSFTLDHPTIEFSTNNPDTLKRVEKVLKDISDQDLRENRVKRRFALIKDLYFSGYFPMGAEFFTVRSKLFARHKQLMSPWEKHSTRPFKHDEMLDKAKKEIYEKYGWLLTDNF